MIYTKLARAVFGTVFAAQYPKSRLVDDEVIDEAENDKDEKEDHSRFALKIVKPRLEGCTSFTRCTPQRQVRLWSVPQSIPRSNSTQLETLDQDLQVTARLRVY